MHIISAAVVSVTFIANIGIGFIAYKNNPKSWTNRLLAFLALIFAFWTIFNYLALQPASESSRLFWVRAVMFVTSFMGSTTFLLSLAFPQDKIPLSSRYINSVCIFILINAIIAPLTFTRVVNLPSNSFSLVPSPIIAFFALQHLFFTFAGFIVLVKRWKASRGILRVQLALFFWANILSLTLLTLSNLVAVVVFKSISYTFFGPTFTLLQVGFLTYAIIKHRLLDIKSLIARSVTYTLLILIMGFLYILGSLILGGYFIGIGFNIRDVVVPAILAFLATFSFQPLRRLLEKLTNEIFFRDSYNSNALLRSLSHIIASNITLDNLVEDIFKELLTQMKITSGYILLTKDDEVIWQKNRGDSDLQLNHKEISALTQAVLDDDNTRIFIFEELPESDLKQFMRDHKLSVVLPLAVKDENIGIMLLGQKSSGDIYSNMDIDVLKIFSPEAAVAVKNALSYEEIKKFNVTLEKEVQSATAELQKANESLKVLDQLKDEFVSVASHELRTPMTAIKSYLWMALAGKGGELSEKQKYYLDRAYNSTDRLIKLVNDMLNVSRIESGRVILSLKKVDMSVLVEDVIAEVKPRADELGINVNVGVSSITLPPVIADPDKIKEVLINLIGNSMKFTPSGGKIIISFEMKDDTIITHVKDNGKGVEVDDIPKLFQKFGLLKGSYTTNQTTQGTGLGLYICKSIIALHKGEIWGKSEGLNKGAEFSFSLKIYEDRLAERMSKEQQGKEGIDIIPTQI